MLVHRCVWDRSDDEADGERDNWESNCFAEIVASGYKTSDLCDVRVSSTRLGLVAAGKNEVPSAADGKKKQASFHFFMHVLVLAAWLEAKYHHASELKTKVLMECDRMQEDCSGSSSDAPDAPASASRTIGPSTSSRASITNTSAHIEPSPSRLLPTVGSMLSDGSASSPPSIPLDTCVFWKMAKRDLQLNRPTVLAYALLVGHSVTSAESDATSESLRIERERLLRVGRHGMMRPLDVVHAWLHTRPTRPPPAIMEQGASCGRVAEGVHQNHPLGHYSRM